MAYTPRAQIEEKKPLPQSVRRFYALIVLGLGIALAFYLYSGETSGARPFKFGLDLVGGTQLVYEADTSKVPVADVDEAMTSLRDVIERRVNSFGVAEPVVQVEQSSLFAEGVPVKRLIVELPGITDVGEAVELIGKTPTLEFKLVDMDSIGTTSPSSIAYIDTGLTGAFLESAALQFTSTSQGGLSNQPIVLVTFNEEGGKMFEQITREHVGEFLAIFLDGALISQPVINEPIMGGSATISGTFTPEEGRELVRNLNLGALPVPIELRTTQSIGAALGEEALKAGLMAGAIGFIALSVFMILWYRLPGVIAVVALGLYVVLMLAIFNLIPVVLTAAGIAGFILSVGLAVDANILIAERMKEELASGKKTGEAISLGFSRAWLAIRDSNITHIIAGVILFWFGTALIKGFALVLALGVFVSMISAITISRTLLLAVGVDAEKPLGRFLMRSGLTK